MKITIKNPVQKTIEFTDLEIGDYFVWCDLDGNIKGYRLGRKISINTWTEVNHDSIHDIVEYGRNLCLKLNIDEIVFSLA